MLKAKVNRSQRSPDEANEAWIIVKSEGDIVCAHCTCMAGCVPCTSAVFQVLIE